MAGSCLSISSVRSRYVLASECALYFPEAIPLCSSAIVNSSSSNAGGAALVADEACGVSLPAVVMLALARPTPPATLLRTKVLRFMVSLDDRIMDRRHFYSEGLAKSNEFTGKAGSKLKVFRVPTSVGFFLQQKSPTKVGVLSTSLNSGNNHRRREGNEADRREFLPVLRCRERKEALKSVAWTSG